MPLLAPEDITLAEHFLQELREQLHTMAQPLTLLQTRLEAALMLREYSDPAAALTLLSALSGDLERACENFHSLQLLASRTLGKHRLKADSAGGNNA